MHCFDRSILSLPFFEGQHRELAERLEHWLDEHRDIPAEYERFQPAERGRQYVRLLAGAGWLEYAVRSNAPGSRPDLRSLCLIREALTQFDDLADFAFAIQGLASAPIAWYGSDTQRAEYLADCAAGRRIGSLALSERNAGSDLAAAATSAAKTPQGFELTGEKIWTSHADIADFHVVLARTGEGPGAMGLSFVLVPADAAGLQMTGNVELIAPRAFGGLRFENCRIPATALVSGTGKGGRGFHQAMEILEFYRVTVGAAALGFCRKAQRAVIAHARGRTLFGGSLLELQMTQDKLSDIATYADSAALLVARAAWEIDMGVKRVAKHASIAKLFATEGAQQVIDHTVQLFGAAGLVAGSVPERLYRQIRSLRIYEGASEIQKLIIAKASIAELGR